LAHWPSPRCRLTWWERTLVPEGSAAAGVLDSVILVSFAKRAFPAEIAS